MADPFRVVVTDFLTEADVELPILGDIARIDLAGATSEADLADLLPTADALIVYHDVPMLTAQSINRLGRCRGIVRAGVGYNNLDLEAADLRGIPICNVPDYGAEEVADHAIMMLLAVVRRLGPCHEAIRRGGWDVPIVYGVPRLRGRTLGLVGCGRIGSATALRARAFGLDVVFFDPFVVPGFEKALGIRRASSLEDLFEQSDFVSVHCYLDETTRHLVNADRLARMRAGGVLINTARGPIVDQQALLEALDSGHLAGAGLDVVEREPLDDDRLRFHPRVLLTPHVAFYSVEGFLEMRRKSAEEVRRLLLGQPLRCPVNRAARGERSC
ncbi:C-terminal binding protein [Tautonia sociabilis]|uniref:C-terminal binding protein n=1 Tax=Tautonia sociabilis TaxID=2080755 RepID=A0A432MDP7_9BACT|nr:C-terminal binding protein [Tautonia sociabilis]RUL82957.1 C-terminal binding protein [Tautonia sociabilis]